MQIAQEMAGYSLGGADLLRRAMGKKKPEEMEKQRAVFAEGSKNNNIDFVVMGVENLEQLVQINDFFQKSNKLKLVDDSTLDFSFDQNLLNPTNL